MSTPALIKAAVLGWAAGFGRCQNIVPSTPSTGFLATGLPGEEGSSSGDVGEADTSNLIPFPTSGSGDGSAPSIPSLPAAPTIAPISLPTIAPIPAPEPISAPTLPPVPDVPAPSPVSTLTLPPMPTVPDPSLPSAPTLSPTLEAISTPTLAPMPTVPDPSLPEAPTLVPTLVPGLANAGGDSDGVGMADETTLAPEETSAPPAAITLATTPTPSLPGSVSEISSSPFSLGGAQCGNILEVTGHSDVHVHTAEMLEENVPSTGVEVTSKNMSPKLGSRSYWSKRCRGPSLEYNNTQWVRLPELLGKALQFTVDLSAVPCGCIASVSLSSMRQNINSTSFKDYFCDAKVTSGTACTEIDLMEANSIAFQSTLHTEDDPWGQSIGYSSHHRVNHSDHRDFDSLKYGPGSECVDTSKPFQVTASFPLNALSELTGVEFELQQAEGSECVVRMNSEMYDGISVKGSNTGIAWLEQALREGMTPVVSYARASDLGPHNWNGLDGNGCVAESACSASFDVYDFAITDIPAKPVKPVHKLAYYFIGGGVFFIVLIGLYTMTSKGQYGNIEEGSEYDSDEGGE